MGRPRTCIQCVGTVVVTVALSSCLPPGLAKYRKKEPGAGSEAAASGGDKGHALERGSDPPGATPMPGIRGPEAGPAEGHARATIYAVDKQTYRFNVRDN